MKKTLDTAAGVKTRFTDTKRVKELIALMAENGLTEIELAEDKSRIVLRRGTVSGGSVPAGTSQGLAMHTPHGHSRASDPPAVVHPVEETLIPVKSPMVGTFYSSPNPESDAFIAIGTEVTKDKTVVCIIEAMKVFNEIHADASGTVVKILVANGQTVEYGQAMFLVKAA